MANNKITDPNNNITQQFAGLPLGVLICQPIIEAAKGQLALCKVYIETLYELAFDNPGADSKDRVTKTILFKFDRMVIDKVTGKTTTKQMELNVPLIALVPLPAFTMDEISVDFNMEIKESTVDTSSSHKDFGTTANFNYWGIDGQVTGNISADSSHTRDTDNSAKYSIHAHAIQQPPSEGMAKLTALFAASMEPIEKAK